MGFSDIGCYGSRDPHAQPRPPGRRRPALHPVLQHAPAAARRAPPCSPASTRTRPASATWSRTAASPGYQGYLNDRCVTIAEALRQAGYHTAHVRQVARRRGAAALAGRPRLRPLLRPHQRRQQLLPARPRPQDGPRRRALRAPIADGFYMTDAFTDHAVKFLDRVRPQARPVLPLPRLSPRPHWPLHAWPEDIAKYRGKYMKGWDALRQRAPRAPDRDGHRGQQWPLTPRDPRGARLGSRRQQGRLGPAHGRLRRADRPHGPEHRPRARQDPQELGQEDNTLVLFLADNGGCAEEKIAGEKQAVARPAPPIPSPATACPGPTPATRRSGSTSTGCTKAASPRR